jgi:hypothetical protein
MEPIPEALSPPRVCTQNNYIKSSYNYLLWFPLAEKDGMAQETWGEKVPVYVLYPDWDLEK